MKEFDGVREGAQDVKGTSCEGCVNGYLYDQRKHWVCSFHPTTMTLDMTASQRVAGIFSVKKNGHTVRKNSTFRPLRVRCDAVAKDLALASRMQRTPRTSLGKGRVENDLKKSVEPVLKECERVGASIFSREEIMVEMCASSAYDTSTLVEGHASSQFLRCLAMQSPNDTKTSTDGGGDGSGEGDVDGVCCQVPEGVFEKEEAPDTTMFGTTSWHYLFRLVEHVRIDCIVKILYKRKQDRTVGDLVAMGPGFQLCACLHLRRRGLQCRHILAALVTQLKRGGEFRGESIHPRWQDSAPWSLEGVKLGKFDGDGSGSYDGGLTGNWGGPDDFEDSQGESAPSLLLYVMRGRAYTNMMEVCTKAARKMSENMTLDTRDGFFEMFGVLTRSVDVACQEGGSGSTETWSGIRDPPLHASRIIKQRPGPKLCGGGQ